MLGHKKVQTTVDHYIKADKKRLNTALENHNLFKITEIEEREIKEN